MAEVTRAATGLSSSLSSSKKLPSFSNNGFPPSSSSSSSKHIYDDVFASATPNKLKSGAISSFGNDDYGEIFGSSKSESGTWQSTYSSIPTLDLPVFEPRSRGSKAEVDYSGVFGGVGDGSFAAMDGLESFDQLKKKAKTSTSSVSLPRSRGQTREATKSHISSQSQSGQAPTNGFCTSLNSEKHLKHKNNEMPADETNDATQVTRVHPIHRSTYSLPEVGPSQKTQTNRTTGVKDDIDLGKDFYPAKKGKHSRNTSSDLGAKQQKIEQDDGSLKASVLGESNSAAALLAAHQASTVAGPSKVVKDDANVESGVKDEVRVMGPSDVGANKQNSEKDDAKVESGVKDEIRVMGPLDVGANKQNSENDAAFQKSAGLIESNSVAISHDTCQASSTVGPQKVVKDDAEVATGFDLGKKKGRHSRITSLDLGDHKQAYESDAEFQRKSRLRSSYSFDASHDQFAARIKVQPSKVVPSSSLPQFFPAEKHWKISENSSCKSSERNLNRSTRGSLPSLDEQLDLNSVAAICAAALQRAIEEAEMQIRLSKEFLEREGQGSTKLSFKDILKLKTMKVKQHADEVNEPRQKKMHENRPRVDRVRQASSHPGKESVFGTVRSVPMLEDQMKFPEIEEPIEGENAGTAQSVPVLEDQMKFLKDREPIKGINAGTAQSVPVLDDQIKVPKDEEPIDGKDAATSQSVPVLEDELKFPMNEEPIEGKNVEASRSIEEDDKREGGEWEAAKHLNQLLSGVKNKIASFMTWQAETEKKEEPKEMEGSRKWLQQSEKSEGESRYIAEDQNTPMCAVETKPEEIEIRLSAEATEREENELTRNNVAQVKADERVDFVPNTEGPTRRNFMFFSFSSERSWDHSDPEEEKKEKAQERGDLGIENRQKQVIHEVKEEWIQDNDKGEEAYGEGSDGITMNHDCENNFIRSSSEESDDRVEEPYPMAGCDVSKVIHEVENHRGVYEEHGDERSESALEEDDDIRVNEDSGDDRGKSTYVGETDRRPNQECDDDRSKSNHEEDSDRRLNEEYGDDKDTSQFTDEEGRDRKLNEELGDEPIHKSYSPENNIERTEEYDECEIYEELGDDDKDTSQFTDKEGRERRLEEEFGDEPIDKSHCLENITLRIDEYDDCETYEELADEPIDKSHCPENVIEKIEEYDECERYEEVTEAEYQQDSNTQVLEEATLVEEIEKTAEATEEIYEWQEDGRDQGRTEHIEEVAGEMNGWEENRKNENQSNHTEETVQEVAEQASCITAEYECKQTETVSLSKAEQACRIDGNNVGVKESIFPDKENEEMMEMPTSSEPETDVENPVFPDEESEMITEVTNISSEPKMDLENSVITEKARESIGEETVLTSFTSEQTMDVDGTEFLDATSGTLPSDDFILHESESDVNQCGQKDIDVKEVEPKSENIMENQTEHLDENVGEAASVSDPEEEKSSVEAVHRRRRWFENREKVGAAEQPSILKADRTNFEIDQEVLEESDLAGGVQIHVDQLDCEASMVTTATEADTALSHEDSRFNVEATHKRKRWNVKRGEQGIPDPPSLFEAVRVNLEMDCEIVSESLPHDMSDDYIGKLKTFSGDTLNVAEADVVVNGEKDKQNAEAAPRRRRWFESGERVGSGPQLRSDEDAGSVETNEEQKMSGNTDKCGEVDNVPTLEEKDDVHNIVEAVNRDQDAVNKRNKEKRKEKRAVERVIREARERAFAEARERARRDAVEKPNVEANQRVGSGAQDRPGKVSAEASSSSDKASMEVKLRAERAAVERATSEARERALQKALSEKASHRSREQAGRHPAERSSSLDPKYHSSSSYPRCSDSSTKGEQYGEADFESPQRRKARLERQNRTMERAAKALEEKNKRDLLAQKEQAARNMLADALDAEVKRWCNGKEGNLRALLSTLQYVLGSDSGWQAVSLTDLVAPTAVRKAYKKATLCVHPDKLQQRGATIQQKYICEKVFDLLKEAWSRFNPEER